MTKSDTDNKRIKAGKARYQKGRAKKLIVTTVYGLVLLFLYFVVCLQVGSHSLSVKVLGFQAHIVSYTGSMEPKLKFGDLIIVKRHDFEDIKQHDIITFLGYTRDGEQIVITHEVYEVVEMDGGRMLITKGTANDEPDFIPVTVDGAEQTNTYIGKFVYKSTPLGNLIAFIKAPQGLLVVTINICVIGLIGLLLESSEPKKRLTTKTTHF